MKQSVLVVGHADADGHLIAEQVRRNLALIDNFDVSVVVDPARTKDHRAWTNLDSLTEIEDADLVFFVDMMFAPASFVEEAKGLVDFVDDHLAKQFFLIDHHPLPLRRLEAAKNLHCVYRPEIFECAVGPRSGMMVVAAICDGQRADVADLVEPTHDTLAVGLRRAAAIGGPLPGEKLLALLKSDCWTPLFQLGNDDREYHRLPRGRRPATQLQSKSLRTLDQAAAELLQHADRARPSICRSDSGSDTMSYDLAVSDERYSEESGQRVRVKAARPGAGQDLETIVTLLEVAALSLTNRPGATFSRSRLIAKAREIGGEAINLRDEDIDIVLKKQSFLRRSGADLCLR